MSEVIQQTHAHGPTPDDRYLNFFFHIAAVSSTSTDDLAVTF
jgi:hypothetical protein